MINRIAKAFPEQENFAKTAGFAYLEIMNEMAEGKLRRKEKMDAYYNGTPPNNGL